mgnify:CR=1 FL=1
MIRPRYSAIVTGVNIVVQRGTDPTDLAARTLAVIDSTNVLWERRRSSMEVVVRAAQIIESERPGTVHAAKMDDVVQLWSDNTGREIAAYRPRKRRKSA